MHDQILLMTRPLHDAKRFVAALDQDALRGVDVLYAPLLEIVPIAPVPDLDGYDGVIFTSGNAVTLVQRSAAQACYCVGERTASQARAKGFDVRVTAHDAQDLVSQLGAINPPAPLVHVCGAHRRGDIAQRLLESGVQTDVAEIYDQRLMPLTAQACAALAGEVPVTLPLFSPRTAMHLAAQVKVALRTTVVALSVAVADAVSASRFGKVEVAALPSGKQMAAAIEKHLRNNTLS